MANLRVILWKHHMTSLVVYSWAVDFKLVGTENFDCRLLLHEHGVISPGDTASIPIKF